MKLSIIFFSLNLIFSIYCAEEFSGIEQLFSSPEPEPSIISIKKNVIDKLKKNISEIKKIKDQCLQEDPEIDDQTEFQDYINNLYAALDFIERNYFIIAQKTLNKLHSSYPDLDFYSIQELLDIIINKKS